MKFTQYFIYTIQRPDRAKIKTEWIEEAIKNPDYTEIQADGRIRKWKKIREEGRGQVSAHHLASRWGNDS